MSYTTIKHPTSGEVYAVELDDESRIIRAAGPLHHSDPTDTGSLQDYLDNQVSEDVEMDAAWLQDAIDTAL